MALRVDIKPELLRWARELVVDRTVLVFAPPLHQRLGRGAFVQFSQRKPATRRNSFMLLVTNVAPRVMA